MTGELKKETVKRPSYYTEYFFTLIQEAISDTQDDILRITKKEWQERVLERSITHLRDPETGITDLIRTNQEEQIQADWHNAWSLRRI